MPPRSAASSQPPTVRQLPHNLLFSHNHRRFLYLLQLTTANPLILLLFPANNGGGVAFPPSALARTTRSAKPNPKQIGYESRFESNPHGCNILKSKPGGRGEGGTHHPARNAHSP